MAKPELLGNRLPLAPVGTSLPSPVYGGRRTRSIYLVTNTAASTGGVSSFPPGTWLLPR